jgi:hypothetical protein
MYPLADGLCSGVVLGLATQLGGDSNVYLLFPLGFYFFMKS